MEMSLFQETSRRLQSTDNATKHALVLADVSYFIYGV